MSPQRGYALFVLMTLLTLGSLSWLLRQAEPAHLARTERTAYALAEAKRVLLGRAAIDASLPGSLPCPDANGDGSADLLSGNDCPSYLGRFPYKTLGVPEPLDGTGAPLWYALSRAFRDDDSNAIDGASSGDLTLNAPAPGHKLAALLFAPGATLPGQSRSPNQNRDCTSSGTSQAETLCAANYLEGANAALNTKTARNLVFESRPASNQFNDQVLAIVSDELLELTSRRIAREAKRCLDDYAAISAGRYPWPAPLTDITNHRGTANVWFGHLPAYPRPFTTGIALDNHAQQLLDTLSALGLALDRYAASNTSATRATLKSAGQTLDAAAQAAAQNQPGQPVLPTTLTGDASAAGRAAQELAKSPANSTVATVRTLFLSSLSGLSSAGFPLDRTMPLSWPASCTWADAPYLAHWRNEVFVQIADGQQPGGSGCLGSTTCLTINGAGSYRAVVLAGGRPLPGQMSRQPAADPPVGYLEGQNSHSSAGNPPTAFAAWRPVDAAWAQVNDQVECLDGRSACR